MTPQPTLTEVAAAAIANARGGRRGVPEIANILEVLERTAPKLHQEVVEDARAVLKAIGGRIAFRDGAMAGGLELLRIAIERGDPPKELIVRVADLTRETQTLLPELTDASS